MNDEQRKEIGKLGGEATRDRHGREHYQKLGRQGGDATAASHSLDHYEKIGSRGGQRVRELIRKGRELEAREGR